VISEFKIIPKPENNRAKAFVAVFGSFGGLIFIISTFIEKYRGVVALVAMGLLIVAITISVKYILSEFVYELTPADGEWLFVVGQRSGKRYTTLCRVSLASVISIEKVERKDMKRIDASYTRYTYVPTMMPDSVYVMTVSNRYERAKVSLQLTDSMAELLRSYAAEARLLSTEDDDE
jgi:hypothetical protein